MSEWAIMFVDMVESTEFKYKYPGSVEQTFKTLYTLIRDHSKGREHIKFTGDGAMVIFRHNPENNGCQYALSAAKDIIRAVDRRNLTFAFPPPIHIRVGIASGNPAKGECYELGAEPELSGTKVDLAARLCQETDSDTILVDIRTMENSKLAAHLFVKCDRRLPLKGIPRPDNEEEHYYFESDRLLRTPKGDNFSKGLLALYPDREALNRDLTPARLIDLAAPNSSILVAGRTLANWTRYHKEMLMAAEGGENEVPTGSRRKNLKFQFLVSSKSSREFLDAGQMKEIEKHWEHAEPVFAELENQDPTHFQVRITDHLFLDGIVCCTILLPGRDSESFGDRVQLVLQDITPPPGDEKSSLLFACNKDCNIETGTVNHECKAHGLYVRTKHIFDIAKEGLTGTRLSPPLISILRRHGESLEARNNNPTAYLHRIIPHLQAIRDDKLNDIPPPICVQLQVFSRCSTDCVMCHHHLPSQRKAELSTEHWQVVIKNLARFGVKSIIFSGGEPLMRPDIAELLDFAGGQRLAIGMLTNGTMTHKDRESRDRVTDAIRRNVTWVAVSIDGTPAADQSIRIRNPELEQRIDLLREFVDGLKDNGPILSATVTLQNQNIQMDLGEASAFIGKLGISRVNFKLATGALDALENKPKYLLAKDELEDFLHFLWNYPVEQDKEPENNLAYLRRCFASGIFNEDDATNGAPLRSFYAETPTRCFTPFLFSLIDSDGEVYTCCHLYRDNHGADKKSAKFRELHSLGNIQKCDFKLEAVWNGQKYSDERRNLARINPNDIHFTPCGECTRHCQHNRALTEIYTAYQDNLDELAKLVLNLKNDEQNVWF